MDSVLLIPEGNSGALRRLALLQALQSRMMDPRADFSPFGLDTVSLGQGLESPELIPGTPSAYDPNFLADTDRFLQDMLALNASLDAMRPPGSKETSPEKAAAGEGNLTVVAGNRSDGVKPSNIVIHEKGNWRSRQRSYNYGSETQEGSFQGGELGQTYQVTVYWEDGSTTVRDVTLEDENQRVVIDTTW